MSVPKYPFAVSIDRRLGHKLSREAKSFETLPAAAHYASGCRHASAIVRVQLIVILDDWSKSE